MVAVALLCLALYVPWTLYPQSDFSHAVFRVAVCLAAVTVAIPRGRLVRWGLALWAVGIVSSVILAPDPWRALWSTHNRNEGAWQAAHYVVLVLVSCAIQRERLVKWLAITAMLATVAAVTPVGWVNGRLAGSAGNPLYLAPLLLIGVWAAWRAEDSSAVDCENARAGYPGVWHALAAVLALAAVATGSKGVGVALLAAGGVLLARRSQNAFLAVGTVLAAAVWFVPIPESGMIRLELGRVALRGIAADPLGWGAEGFPFVWDTFWRGLSPTGENWHDRTHSLLLDRAIEWGVVGVAGWLIVVYSAWKRAETPERAAIAAYLGFGMTMFEMMWGAAAFSILLGYVFRGWWRVEGVTDGVPWSYTDGGCRPRRVDKRIAWTAAGVALVVGSLGLAQSRAAVTAASLPAMQEAIERWSPIGGDIVELYLKAPQTRKTLDWADDHVELRSPHATQQAFLLAAWDRGYCVDLKMVAPKRPDVQALCRK